MIEFGNRIKKVRRALKALKKKSDSVEIDPSIFPWWHQQKMGQAGGKNWSPAGEKLKKKMDDMNPGMMLPKHFKPGSPRHTKEIARLRKPIDDKRRTLKQKEKRLKQWGDHRKSSANTPETIDRIKKHKAKRGFTKQWNRQYWQTLNNESFSSLDELIEFGLIKKATKAYRKWKANRSKTRTLGAMVAEIRQKKLDRANRQLRATYKTPDPVAAGYYKGRKYFKDNALATGRQLPRNTVTVPTRERAAKLLEELEAGLDELMEFGKYVWHKGKSYTKRDKILGVQAMRTEVVDGKRRFKDWNEDYAIAKRKFINARDQKRAKRAK